MRLGNAETAVPRLLAMLCILAVFIPSFFMQGAARALFVPLSLAVGFSMIASYLLSSTFVPVLSVWLLRHHHPRQREPPSPRLVLVRSAPGRLRRLLQRVMPLRWAGRAGLPASAPGWCIWLVGGQLGHGDLPARSMPASSSSGCGRRPARASSGPRRSPSEALEIIKEEVGPDNVAISLGYVGVVPLELPDQHRLPVDAAARRRRCCASR